MLGLIIAGDMYHLHMYINPFVRVELPGNALVYKGPLLKVLSVFLPRFYSSYLKTAWVFVHEGFHMFEFSISAMSKYMNNCHKMHGLSEEDSFCIKENYVTGFLYL